MTEQKIHGLSGLAHFAPVTHGMTKFDLEIKDGLVASAKPVLGSMHRGAEKLFESRDYRQILMLANRHEWVSAFAGELGIAQLLEDALGIEVPDATGWFRTFLLEYTRVTSHLAFLMGFPWKSAELAVKLRTNREFWVNHVADYTGSRMHPMVTRIGGLTHTPTENWLAKVSDLISVTKEFFAELEAEINSELETYGGIGVLTKVDAVEFAVSGPVARASGYDIDLRRTGRGLKYQELSESKNNFAAGDVVARLSTLIMEIKQALTWLGELTPICESKLNDEIDVLLPKVIRVPEGIYTHDLETPLGIASWLLVSQNDKYPYRLKLRPASLPTLLATEKVLVGTTVENLDAVIASMPFVSGDVDR